MQNKEVVKGKVDKDATNRKKFKIKSHKANEHELTIELTAEGDYEVEKLSTDGLPAAMVVFDYQLVIAARSPCINLNGIGPSMVKHDGHKRVAAVCCGVVVAAQNGDAIAIV